MSYEQSAPYYDAIYESMKNYDLEAQRVHALVQRYGKASGCALLDVACGTGLHDQYLEQWYDLTGIDLSAAQLEIARRRLPDVTFHQADMTSFDLDCQFAVVTCLFSAIGHLSAVQMPKAVANMARHLAPGGLLIIEPWLLPHMYQEGYFSANFVDQPGLKLARMSHTRSEGQVVFLRMEHLIATATGTDHFVEHHELTMSSEGDFLEAFQLAGLAGWYEPSGINSNGRGVFIGRRPVR